MVSRRLLADVCCEASCPLACRQSAQLAGLSQLRPPSCTVATLAITPMISVMAVHCFVICSVLPAYKSLEHPYFLKSGQPSVIAGPLTRARGKDSFGAMLTVVVVSTK